MARQGVWLQWLQLSDERRGVTLEDSDGSSFGDDFFNSHNTIMVVLRQESPTTLLLINPHVQNVYHNNNSMSMVRRWLRLLSEKDAELAQNLGQLQPFTAVSPQECVGQLPSFEPT